MLSFLTPPDSRASSYMTLSIYNPEGISIANLMKLACIVSIKGRFVIKQAPARASPRLVIGLSACCMRSS